MLTMSQVTQIVTSDYIPRGYIPCKLGSCLAFVQTLVSLPFERKADFSALGTKPKSLSAVSLPLSADAYQSITVYETFL